jgi:hypothetical protein
MLSHEVLMRHRFSINVNGKRRSSLVLAVPEPIPNLDYLSIRWAEAGAPNFLALSRDYDAGAYTFSECSGRSMRPGTYRAQEVCIYYTDGTSAASPLADAIVVRIPAIQKQPKHVPSFTVR